MATLEERIAERVIKEVARIFKKDVSELTRDTRFVEDLQVKSLNVVELVAVLEDAFEVEVPFAEARRRSTIGEAIDLVISLRRR
ncbi:acyl carrier protein [Chloroflexota bacterium]